MSSNLEYSRQYISRAEVKAELEIFRRELESDRVMRGTRNFLLAVNACSLAFFVVVVVQKFVAG